MTGARGRTAALALGFLISAGLACGAGAQTYLDEYNLYNQALADRDKKAAAAHGYAAWQAAEAELGDHRLTAILAFNYGLYVLYDDPAAALPALRRADALVRAGIAESPSEDLSLFITYADFGASGERRREANTLRALLNERLAGGKRPTPDEADMLFVLAGSDVRNKRYREAEESAAAAELAISDIYPENAQMRASAAIYQGVAALMPPIRTKSKIAAAVEHFERAMNMFPPQSGLETFDPIFAAAIAWEGAARAVYISENYGRRSVPSASRSLPVFTSNTKPMEECGIEWAERDPPNYPTKPEQRGYVGAVVIGYQIGESLGIKDVRVLGEVPADMFSAAVLKEVKNWRLKAPPISGPQCSGPFLTIVTFVLR